MAVFFPAILKSCESFPLFVTVNVTSPFAALFLLSVNASSDGLPAVTVTVLADCPSELPDATAANAADAATATATATDDPFHDPISCPPRIDPGTRLRVLGGCPQPEFALDAGSGARRS